jgi:hypothetical protein
VLSVQTAVGFDRPGVSVLALSAIDPEKRIIVESIDPRAVDLTREPRPDVLPYLVLSFPWRISLGTLVTLLVAFCFATPHQRIESARVHEETLER